jgi:hypothetical protein
MIYVAGETLPCLTICRSLVELAANTHQGDRSTRVKFFSRRRVKTPLESPYLFPNGCFRSEVEIPMPIAPDLDLQDGEVTLVFERDFADTLNPPDYTTNPTPYVAPHKAAPRPLSSRDLPFAYD